MMLDTADNKIFFPRFYDIDTICSYDNSGQLKFDVDIEMEQGYWNTSSSRLWTRIRDLMHNDIVTTYNNMRQNGVSYENMMHYIYDEQIAKIPQAYYNKDYDIKYAPFADSYIGMAHGDTYEHVKRWLKQRFTFVDTLFDYAPSYNNDVLTIRANTTELMTLEIETYTPVYLHLSWYNGQMDKKKIDGKTSVEFSGKAQAATDQEVLIYGGSNVKSIKGIQSANPNRLILGSATKLTELDASNCPLLAEINMNKANLSPHEYLNKVNLSNCPLLEGNLRLNNSPLVQEINIKGTNITGMNLPSSIRNLQILRLPNTMTDLTLNDASMLHTLEFDEGVALQSISMTNCNALENVINFDLLQTPSITLNNSYNNIAELYFKDTTNLSLSNMNDLERVIFTPNNEYETFEMINVANAPNYKVTTFNCPKLSTFMTTAPYRESYNNCGMNDKEVVEVVELLDGTYKMGGFWGDTGGYMNQTSYRMYEANIPPDADELIINIEMVSAGSAIILHYFEDDTFISRLTSTSKSWSETLTKPSNCNRVIISIQDEFTKSVSVTYNKVETVQIKDYGSIKPNTTFTANSIDISSTQFTDVKLLCTTDTNTLKLPTTVKNFYCDSSFDLDTDYLEDGEYDVVHGELVEPYTTDYKVHRDKRVTESISWNAGNFNTIYPSISHGDNYSEKIYIQEGGEYTVSCSPGDTCGSWFKVFGFNNSDSVIWQYGGSSTSDTTGYSGTIPSGVVYVRFARIDGGPVEITYTADATGEVQIIESKEKNTPLPNFTWTHTDYALSAGGGFYVSNDCKTTDFIKVTPSTTVSMTNGEGTSYNFQCICYYDENKNYLYGENWIATVSLPSNAHYIRFSHRTVIATDSSYTVVYSQPVIYTPNLIPSSADGSLIFSMYAPNNTVAPASGTWDLKGLEFDNFHTFGMNNDVRGEYEVQNIPNFEGIVFTSDCFRGSRNSSTYAGYFQMGWLNLNNATVITSDGSSIGMYIPGSSFGHSSPATFTEPCVALSFYPTVEWVKIIENGTEYHFEKSSLKLGTKNVSLSDKTAITLSVSSIVTGDLQSITMPARYDDYNITIKNANISPKTHNTMLYPLLVNEDNPITGTLDYTNYAGKHLSWSFAYTDEEYVDIIQPKGELINSYEYRYNAFYDTEYEFVNPYEIARYTSNASGVLPNFNTEFTYTYDEIDNGDGTYTTKVYANSLDNLPTNISFYTKSALLSVEHMNVSKVTSAQGMFYQCTNVTYINSSNWDTSSMTNMGNMFNGCSGLTSLDISGFVTSNVTNMANIFSNCKKLTSLDVSGFDTSNVLSMYEMFRNCTSLTSLDLSGFDTSNVTNMYRMFQNCKSLTSLDLSGFDTSNVTNMNNIFQDCSGLTSLDISGLDTSKIANMAYMFSGCSGLTSLDLSGFETGDVTDMNNMFSGCSGLTSLDLSGFDTGNVTDMDNMFRGCSGLTSMDLSGFDTGNVTDMAYMFRNCTSLTSLDLSGFDTGKVTNMVSMFHDCKKLTSLDVSGFDTSKVTLMNDMFVGCIGLTSLDLSGFDTSEVTSMASMFNACNNLTSLDLSGFDTSKVTDMNMMFRLCNNLTSLHVESWSLDKVNTIIPQLSVSPSTSTLYGSVIIDESTLPSGWVYKFNNILEIARYTASASGVVPTFNNGFTGYNVNEIDNNNNTYTVSIMTDSLDNLPTSISFSDKTGLLTVDKLNTKNVTNMYNMFYNCYNLTSLDLSGFNTSKVTDMASMFRNCSRLTSLDVSGFKTSEVVYMNEMFAGCRGLTSLDVSGFDTKNVTDMNNMFYNCSKLTSLNLSGLDASKVTDMGSMFYNCSRLTSLNLSNFKTSNVTNMNSMFYYCSNLTSLDVSGFDTKNVTNMNEMFRNCSSLTSLDLSGFDTSNVTLMGSMFRNCSKLTSLDLSGLDANKVTDMGSMFYYCINLTSLDLSDFKASNVDTTYAMFQDCSKLTSLNLSGLDASKVTDMGSMFKGCSELTLLDSIQNISLSLDLFVTKLDATSLLDVIDNLATVSTKQTLTLGSTLLAKLTEDQIAIAVNKGWTVS